MRIRVVEFKIITDFLDAKLKCANATTDQRNMTVHCCRVGAKSVSYAQLLSYISTLVQKKVKYFYRRYDSVMILKVKTMRICESLRHQAPLISTVVV